MELFPQYLEAIREYVEPFVQSGLMTAEQTSRAEAKLAEIIKREAVNFYPQHLAMAHESVAHAIRFYKPKKSDGPTCRKVMKKTRFAERNGNGRKRTAKRSR